MGEGGQQSDRCPNSCAEAHALPTEMLCGPGGDVCSGARSVCGVSQLSEGLWSSPSEQQEGIVRAHKMGRVLVREVVGSVLTF